MTRYTSGREGERSERRTIVDVKQAHLVLGMFAMVLTIFASAAAGVYATAHRVVPPIALEALEPRIQELKAEDARLDAEMRMADDKNIVQLRREITQLREDLRENRQSLDELKTVLLATHARSR